MKKKFLFLLAMCLLFVFASVCASSAAQSEGDKKPVLAYILNAVDDWNQSYVNAGIARCNEYGFVALSMNPDNDVQRQIDFVQSCISQNVDMIAIQPIDNAALAPILRRAGEAGIIINSVYQLEPELGLDEYVVYTVYGQFEAG